MKNKLMCLVLGLILGVSSVASADPVGGDVSDSEILSPGEGGSYKVLLRGDEMTRFKVVGDGYGDIDCFLYNEHLNIIDSDETSYDGCVIDVTPRWSGWFYFRIKNTGRISDRYLLRIF